MTIGAAHAYASFPRTQATYAAENTDGRQASTSSASQNTETGTAVTAKAAAVTGTTGSNLSKETISHLIRATQETKTSSTAADEYNGIRSEEHTSELQSHHDLVCRLLLEKKKKKITKNKIEQKLILTIKQKRTVNKRKNRMLNKRNTRRHIKTT